MPDKKQVAAETAQTGDSWSAVVAGAGQVAVGAGKVLWKVWDTSSDTIGELAVAAAAEVVDQVAGALGDVAVGVGDMALGIGEMAYGVAEAAVELLLEA